MSLIKTLNEIYQKNRAETTRAIRAELEKTLVSFVEKYSEIIDGMYWVQFTPWFNDGDDCVFRVNELEFLVNGSEEDGAFILLEREYLEFCIQRALDARVLDDKSFYSQYKINRSYYVDEELAPYEYAINIQNHPTYAEFEAEARNIVSAIIGIDGEIMKLAFGDHVKVVVTKDGIYTEEEEHD